MYDYYLTHKNVIIPFVAKDDNHAIECAKNFIRGKDYTGFKLMNHDTRRIFDMSGNDI